MRAAILQRPESRDEPDLVRRLFNHPLSIIGKVITGAVINTVSPSLIVKLAADKKRVVFVLFASNNIRDNGELIDLFFGLMDGLLD